MYVIRLSAVCLCVVVRMVRLCGRVGAGPRFVTSKMLRLRSTC